MKFLSEHTIENHSNVSPQSSHCSTDMLYHIYFLIQLCQLSNCLEFCLMTLTISHINVHIPIANMIRPLHAQMYFKTRLTVTYAEDNTLLRLYLLPSLDNNFLTTSVTRMIAVAQLVKACGCWASVEKSRRFDIGWHHIENILPIKSLSIGRSESVLNCK